MESSLLRYPLGSNARDQTVLNIRDINSLRKRKYLTDQLVDMWLSYIHTEKISLKLKESIYIFSSLFYTSLLRSESLGAGSSLNLNPRRWTRRISIDIFEKEYLVFPVVVESHWILVIVCNSADAHAAQNNDREPCPIRRRTEHNESASSGSTAEKSKFPPMLLILDSYRARANQAYAKIAATLRSFLCTEWKARRGSDFKFNTHNLPLQVPQVPQQSNVTDCGVYILQYFETFFGQEDPTIFTTTDNVKDLFSNDWIRKYRREIETEKREEMYQTILTLLNSQGQLNQQFPNIGKLFPKTIAGLPVLPTLLTNNGQLHNQVAMSELQKTETLKVVKDFFINFKQSHQNKNGNLNGNSHQNDTNQSTPNLELELQNALAILKVDAAKPTTKVTIRFADGSRVTINVNLCQPVSSIREFICHFRPCYASTIFNLMTSFPSAVLDERLTIEDANLINSVITQQLK